ncbi:MAG: IS630 family transposase, partial [Planctomycetes bacterium]|nr:IS630 family transposase [Planctomycetota bacterium]
ITLSSYGINKRVISRFTDCNMEMVYRWSRRCDFNDNARPGRPLLYTEETHLKTIAFYCQTTPLPDCGRWTLRWAEKRLKQEDLNPVGQPISRATIQRILKNHTLKPHLSKYFLQITDPDFFPKMQHIISLYMNKPEYLFCFDECPGIQVLQRLAPHLQTETMRKRLEEFEYIRNGTIDVFAFLRVKSGKIFAECRADHTSETFLEIMDKHIKTLPENETIHYIMDNLASHASYDLCKLVSKYSKIQCPPVKELHTALKRRQWLQSENKRIVIHYTPFHGSWLNMVEIWFGILNQKCLKESFASPDSMYNAIYSFLDEWNTLLAHPFKWSYDGKGLCQKAVERFIKMLEISTEKMHIKFMIKQLFLMTNLIEAYWEKVEFSTWLILYDLINSKFQRLHDIILRDEKQKRKIKAENALSCLFETLRISINCTQKQVA